MCLIAFCFSPDSARHLLLAANRDEFHDRPARPMAWWGEQGTWLAGRDERAGGTWLAIGRDGRWSAVTNFRDPRAGPGARSRGELPLAFLSGQSTPADYARAVHLERTRYAPFNLLAGDAQSLWYCSTHRPAQPVQPGVHALSNGVLDEPWPKSRRIAGALRGLLDRAGVVEPDQLFSLMDDRQPGDDEALPNTGVGLDHERLLSPPFIVSPRYGTRCSTVLCLGEQNLAAERRFGTEGEPLGQLVYHWPGKLQGVRGEIGQA